MELSRLRLGEILAGLSGIALIVAMALLDWYGVEVPPGTEPVGGFDAFRAFDVVDILLVAVALSAIGLAVLTAVQRTSAVPIALSAFVALGGIIASVVLLFRIIDTPDLTGERFVLDRPGLNIGFETTLEAGIFVGLGAAIGIAAGAWLAMRDDRA